MNDLVRGTHLLRRELDSAVARVLDRGYYVLGPENEAFSAELSGYVGTESVLVGNGTDAIQLALTAVGIGPGDGVVTVANAGAYTSTAVQALGATAVYCEIEPSTLLASLRTITAAVNAAEVRVKALVVTHLFGSAVDIEPIVTFAQGQGIAVVEDCAQALGASRDGRKVGTFGDVATTSFYPTKNLGALGDGGAVLTTNHDLAERIRRLRQYGWSSKYRITEAGGMNSRLDEMQAAILRVKLPHLDSWNERRRTIHSRYEQAIGGGARLVSEATPGFVGHLAVVDTDDRPRAKALFSEASIATDIHYPIPDHMQPLHGGVSGVSLPETERSAQRILTIPLFPELRDEEVARIAGVLGSL